VHYSAMISIESLSGVKEAIHYSGVECHQPLMLAFDYALLIFCS
jgi:hypothetical protein